ncbi:anhydro-N-acetylmuramic acid kinase [Thiosulfatimonas sediminis]|uniref:Anhydro-N-acetylmuramic acid kinase n=1 Tax=Thiosulfatimonas sediminis TaxID=2675054 RepID=A0A6F8PS81_9GAMM|nr:anhydro-N-acetylmuramic acid kinase [Thiosulfatimonas sediminis]BBP44975.1 anhydro-N-acetylmuramic acid kinase [Thiosulfatimonas sediminis]
MSKTALYIGLMSGTSVDAIDAALVAISGKQIKLQHFTSTTLEASLKEKLLNFNQQPQIALLDFCQLHSQLGQAFAASVKQLLTETQLSGAQITAIGSHGQTIFHAPEVSMSLQIGHPALIAKQTGILTVGDFRIDDMALGGQGAPFAPVFHQMLFAQHDKAIVVNIGGIANISIIAPPESEEKNIGWDCGPGNGLMDEATQRFLGQPFDEDGNLARQGQIQHALLTRLRQDDYFSKAAPKSSGRDYFNWPWLNKALSSSVIEDLPIEDLLATLSELTAICIATDIRKATAKDSSNRSVWICGGGALNEYLIQRIQTYLPNYQVQSSQAAGHHPSTIEAMLFAWLAHQRLNDQPIALSAVTGATRDAVLGGIWHP